MSGRKYKPVHRVFLLNGNIHKYCAQVLAVSDDTAPVPDVERLQFVINLTMENWEIWQQYCDPADFRLAHRQPRDPSRPAAAAEVGAPCHVGIPRPRRPPLCDLQAPCERPAVWCRCRLYCAL